MNYEQLIQWELILEGHKGFEKLANEFVVREAGFSLNWKPTQFTRDGNKDGIAILYCFLPLSGRREEQIWMEAKYSLTHKTLSRYKLDSTIVSAIIEGNVKEIIFVTNIEIESQVEHKIRKALTNALGFEGSNVAFYSKWTLEKWLIINQDIYKKYFPNQIEVPTDFFKELYCTDKLTFHEQTHKLQFFTEPLSDLYTGQTYSCHLKIFSPFQQVIKIKPLISSLFVKNNFSVIDNTLALKSGVNSVEFCVEFESPDVFSGPLMQVGSLHIETKGVVTVTRKVPEPLIFIDSQETSFQAIITSLSNSFLKEGLVFHKISGPGGIGKTRIFEKILQSPYLEKRDLIIAPFSEDQFMNSRMLLDVVLSVLFYYLESDAISHELITELRRKNTFVSVYLEHLVQLKDLPEQLYKAFLSYDSKGNILFAANTSLKYKVLLLDDLHKLDDNNRFFLNKMLSELSKASINGFVVLCARPEYFESTSSLSFDRNCLSVRHDLEVTLDDVLNSLLKNGYSFPELAARILFREHKFNCLMVAAFLRYLSTFEGEMDETELIICYKKFQEDGSFIKLVLASFERLDGDEESEALLNAVYLSNAGIQPSVLKDKHKKYLPQLIDLELVRYNSEGRIVPFHDLYTHIFRNKFQSRFAKNFAISGYLLSETEELKYSLESVFYDEEIALSTVQDKLQKLSDNHQFYSVIYVLESIFLGNNLSKYKNRLGRHVYFELFFLYARAVSHTSKRVSGTDFYRKIIKEAAYESNSRVMIIRAKALSEMVNSSFEHLQLKEVREYTEELEPLINLLFNNGELPEEQVECNSSYILMREIKILEAMLLDQLETGENLFQELEEICSHSLLIERRGVLRIRFARSLFHHDMARAMTLIQQGIQDRLECIGDPNDKWVSIGAFELTFLHAVQGQKTIKIASEAQEKLKSDLFNDYRRAMNAIAALYLVKGDMNKALEVFSMEADIPRAANPRYTAIRWQLLAAYEFKRGNYLKSEFYLREQYKYFQLLGESYQNVIEHNLSTVTLDSTSGKIEFAITSKLTHGTFYIDLRLW